MKTLATIDGKLKLLTLVVLVLLAALFYVEHMFRSDGVMFQAVSELLSGFAAILMSELRKEFGLNNAPPPGTIIQETQQRTVQGPAEASK